MALKENAMQGYQMAMTMANVMTFGLAGSVMKLTGADALAQNAITSGCTAYESAVLTAGDVAYASMFPREAMTRMSRQARQ